MQQFEVQQKVDQLEFIKNKPKLRKSEYQILTGLSLATINRLLKNGELKYMKLGNSVLIDNIFLNN